MVHFHPVSGADLLEPPRNIGRYLLFREIGHGGMATVHLGRLHGPAGFARTVAIKKLHAQFSRDPEFVSMFLDEARLAARIQHPNVVSVLDVVASEGELFLIMDYVHGESLFTLFKEAAKTKTPIPRRIFVSIIANVLYGLDAAHEARSDTGTPLDIVHRDVSPQNVLLGIDGVARLLDFGVAKASQRVHLSTQDGKLKGKLSYMAPEQVSTGLVDRRADVYATGVMLWEGLTGQRLYASQEVGALVGAILAGEIKPPSSVAPSTPEELDQITMKALARSPNDRYATAREMATELERAIPPATPRQIGEWVAKVAGIQLKDRAETIAKIEGRAAPTMGTSDFRLPAIRGSKTETDAAKAARPPAKPSEKTDAKSDERRIPSLVDDSSLTPTKQPAENRGVTPPTPSSEISASDILPPQSASLLAGKEVSPASADETEAPLVVAGAPSKRKTAGRIAGLGLVAAGILVLAGHSCAPKTAVHAAPPPTVAANTSTAPHISIDTLPVPSSTSTPSPPATSPNVVAADTTAATTIPAPTAAATSHGTSIPHRNTAKNKKDCDPPYTIDATGVRVPKKQCL